jgi:hypothetical protein
LAGQPHNPFLGSLDGMDVILQDDLLGRMVKADRRQPTPVWAASGTQTGVSSPARCGLASITRPGGPS